MLVDSSNHCIFIVYREHVDRKQNALKKVFEFKRQTNKLFSNSRSIDGSNHCIFRMDRECVVRIHREHAVAMAMAPIDPRLLGD